MFQTLFTRMPELDRTFAVMEELRRRLDEATYGRASPEPAEVDWLTGTVARGWPRGQLVDQNTELMLQVELPGVADADVKLSVHEDVLTLSGTRKTTPPKGFTAHLNERGNFQFSRSWSLPQRVNVEKARAELKNGLLTVTLPKHPDSQPRQIAVSAS